jgi:Ca2+-binding RTX toxin-like protein
MRTIKGTKGNDRISGTTRDDYIIAGDGDDTVYAGSGSDYLYGGNGNDLLHGQDGNDSIYGDAGSDILWGELGNDSLDGGDGDDTLNGGAGDDSLQGRAGNDIMDGGDGNDSIQFAPGGNDTAIGGSGIDRFVINDNLGSVATINDFDASAEAMWRGVGYDANADAAGHQFWVHVDSEQLVPLRSDGNGQATVSFDGQYTTLQLYHADGNLHADVTVRLLGSYAPESLHVMLWDSPNTYIDGLIFL